MAKLLDSINSPTDLKQLKIDQLPQLASEIREALVSALSDTGGHLGGNLGVVELTIALHYVFDSPEDKIVWDVSHQCYVHKMLTGRRDRLDTIRQYQGLAGFTKITESEHDAYGAGHASTAISAAYGMAAGRDLQGGNNSVIAVVGDGAMTGGLAYEGLNNLGSAKRRMLVILNDNSMSISPNVGAISEYLTGLISDQTYNKLKGAIWDLTGKVKGGTQFREAVSKIDASIKNFFVPGVLFEKMGVRYFGPLDGHDIAGLIETLKKLKSLPGPRLLHIRTEKGKGYRPAEDDDCRLHGVKKFDKVTGKGEKSNSVPYTNVFAAKLVELAHEDNDLVAITAAMPTGTGLTKFAREFPERFFDVGIAEQHALVFAGGLARTGRKPVVAIYSTFLQRAYDMLIHDLTLQKLPVLLAVDRAGLVGNDGPTHHGCFDLAYLRLIPGMQVCAPRNGAELRGLLELALADLTGPVAIRFPRAGVPDPESNESTELEWGSWEVLRQGSDIALLAVGSMVEPVLRAAEMLAEQGRQAAVINCRFVKPMDEKMLAEVVASHRKLVTIEEGTLIGGFGSGVNEWLCDHGKRESQLLRLGIPDRYIEHGNRDTLLKLISLDSEGIAASVGEFLAEEGPKSVTLRQGAAATVARLAVSELVAKEGGK
ncbi:MAG: 1-deoxy-D-xylulose-5-phosphate synthase [bacterium]